jgi:spore germination cell wall hydrolase CwlJ-like protein
MNLRTAIAGIGLVLISTAVQGASHIRKPKTQIVHPKRRSDQTCLAETIYYEARGLSEQGQIAVAYVALNRSRAKRKSLCAIVYEKGQFSWVHNRSLLRRKKDPAAWQHCNQLAKDFMANPGRYRDPTHGATMFHVRGLRVRMSIYPVQTTANINGHTFYRITDPRRKD